MTPNDSKWKLFSPHSTHSYFIYETEPDKTNQFDGSLKIQHLCATCMNVERHYILLCHCIPFKFPQYICHFIIIFCCCCCFYFRSPSIYIKTLRSLLFQCVFVCVLDVRPKYISINEFVITSPNDEKINWLVQVYLYSVVNFCCPEKKTPNIYIDVSIVHCVYIGSISIDWE